MNKRIIPNGYTLREYTNPHASIYLSEMNENFYALGFSGKKSKKDFHFRFKTLEEREIYIDKYINRLIEHEKTVKNRKEKRLNFSHSLKIGDILYSSWGYDQTNVDFYQVIDVLNKTIKIREIESAMPQGEDGFMTGNIIPVKDKFTKEKTLLKRVLPDNCIKITSFSWARLWDGKPKRISWYA